MKLNLHIRTGDSLDYEVDAYHEESNGRFETVELKQNNEVFLEVFTSENKSGRELANALIGAGLDLLRIYEEQDYARFDEYMEEVAQEEERRGRERAGEEVYVA